MVYYGNVGCDKLRGGEQMILTNKIDGLIAEHRLTYGDVAEYLGVTRKTFSTKLKKGVFWQR